MPRLQENNLALLPVWRLSSYPSLPTSPKVARELIIPLIVAMTPFERDTKKLNNSAQKAEVCP